MKNYFFRCTAIFILILSLGVGDMWGWSMMYLVGDHWNSWADQHRMWESTEGKRYVYIYMEQGYMFRFDMNVDNADPANMKPVGLGGAANLDDNDTGVRVAKYDTGTPQHINYSGEAGHTYSGIICVHSDQITTYDDDKKNADKNPFIWLTRPSVKIRHNWNGSSWTDETMTDKYNGKYEYTGRYGGNYTYAGITDNEYDVNGSPLYKKFTDATLEGSPVVGNRCLFEFNSSGYIGVDDKDHHRGSLKIIKVDTVTYNANGASSGTAPSVTEAIYNRASTLATNTGSLTKSNYYFNGWNTQADGKGTHYDAGGSITVVGNTTLYAEWTPQWTILGKDIYEGDAEKDKMGNWDVFNGLPFVSEHTHRGTITLDAHTAYNFKVLDRATTTWYGCGTLDNDYTYVGQTDAVEINSTNLSGHNVMLMTTKAGEYTFEWDEENKTLKILFPEDIVHPSMDYIYMEKYSDWNGGSYSYIHNWYTGTPDVPLTDGGVDPKMTASFTSKSPAKTFYTYPVLTKYPHFKIAQGLNGGDGGVYHATSNMEVTDDHKGHYVYHNGSAWVWATFQVYIKLENQGADEGKKGTLGVPVAFNDTALSTKINKPVKSHYDFGGYYTAAEGGGVQIIDADGNWQTDVTDYTSSGKWIHAGDTTTLYAKWTKHPYTITLQVSPTGAAGTISPSGTTTGYYSVNSANITATPNPGWKFKEWQFERVDADYIVWAEAPTYTSTSNPIQVKVKANATLTAVFEPRYELVGSKDANNSDKGGMPGWTYDGTGAFAVLSSSPSVNLTCTCSLEANTKYKFVIHDRADGKNYGDGEDGKYELIEKNRAHCKNENMDMKFQTTGAAKYVFQIDEIDGSGRPYVKLLWPRQVNFGWKYVNADEPTMKDDGGGGTVTVYAHEAGEKRAIASSGGYIMQGGTISFTAHPYVDYDFAGWWGTYSYDGNRLFETDSISWSVTGENANAFAKFTEKTNTLTTGTNWNTDGNWSKGHVPTQDEVAVIQSPVEVNSSAAKAKKVLLMQDGGHTGKIDIPAGKELVVRATIKKTTDGSTYGATGYEDIVIGSSLAEGNGALVMNTNDGTNKATVYFATKAKKVGEHNVNQFIGTPFNDENDILYDYYGTKIYCFMAGHDGSHGPENEWKRVASTGEKMNGFYGYNILTNQTTEPVMEMQGTLNRSAEETISGFYNGSTDTENMFANSWVAPIYIPNFEDGDFNNIEKTIYIFNAGTPEQQAAAEEGSATATSPGQYIVLPINASPWAGMNVIPSMQAFSVFATGSDPSLTFNYTRLVYNPSTNGTAAIEPTRAPRRTEAEQTAPTVLKLKVSGESGYAANIVMLNRADFSEGFDDGWDGRFLPGDDAAPQLYAVTADGNMAINCSPDIEGTLLGFKAGEADDLFTFTFEYDDEALYLYDTQTQLYTRVQTGNSYTFTTADEDAHNRFILTRKAPSITTGMEASNTPSPGANKVIIDNHLYIFRAGMLYDATGRIIK